MNLRDGSFLLFLCHEDPSVGPGSLPNLEDLDSKTEDLNELSSVVVKDTGPSLCDGYPRAAS